MYYVEPTRHYTARDTTSRPRGRREDVVNHLCRGADRVSTTNRKICAPPRRRRRRWRGVVVTVDGKPVDGAALDERGGVSGGFGWYRLSPKKTYCVICGTRARRPYVVVQYRVCCYRHVVPVIYIVKSPQCSVPRVFVPFRFHASTP